MILQDEWAALEEQAGAMVPQLGGLTGDAAQPLWRGPDLLRKEATRLAAREARPLEAFGREDARAYEWAAERGINLTKHEDHIRRIDLTRQGPSIDNFNPLDLDGYLRQHHSDAISQAIQEAQKQTEREFREQYTRSIQQDWDETKRKILDSLGHKTAKRGAPLLPQALPHMLPSSAGAAPTSTALALPAPGGFGQPPLKQRRLLDVSTERYGGVVKQMAHNHLHQASARGAGPFQMLAQAQGQMGQLGAGAGRPQRADKTAEFWDLAARIVGEKHGPQNASEPIPREGQFKQAWAQQSPAVVKHLLTKSRQALEFIYEEHIKRTIAGAQALAERGGRPEFEWDVIGFLRVNYNNAWDGYGFTDFLHLPDRRRVPVWPLVYFCFRCGHHDAACRVLSGQLSGGHRPANCSLMASALDALRCGHPISDEIYQRMRQEYDLHAKTSTDIYHQAMFLMAGRCDQNATMPGQSTGVNASIEDYLWVKAVLSRGAGEQLPSWMAEASKPSNMFARTPFETIQSVIRKECGPKHFTDGQDPFLYTKVLLFTQQFEEAVNHLYRTEKQLEAVHLMLALDHYGLLRTGRADNSETHSNVDIAERIYQYVLPMVPVDPTLAFHYIFLLEGIPDRASFNKLISETLLLQSSGVETLVGTIHGGAPVLNGVIPKFLGVHRCCKLLREEAADVMAQRGRFEESVKLKVLGGDFANGAVLLTKTLCRHMNRKSDNREKSKVVALADQFLVASDRSMQHPDANSGNVFHINQADNSGINEFNLKVSLALAHFYNSFHQGPSGYQSALQYMDRANILPRRQLHAKGSQFIQHRAGGDSQELEELRARIERLKPCVQRGLPEVCLCVMRILCYQYKQNKTNLAIAYTSQANQQRNNMLLLLRSQASALLRFYTSPNLSIPIDATVNAEMNRLETTMRS